MFRVVSLPLAKHYAISNPLSFRIATVRLRQGFGGQPSPSRSLARQPKLEERRLVGLSRFELLTPRLSSVCSNQLSYRPSAFLVGALPRTRLRSLAGPLRPAPSLADSLKTR